MPFRTAFAHLGPGATLLAVTHPASTVWPDSARTRSTGRFGG
ncbi:MAG TPA: hypothetical protein VGN81_16425 [Pseudonocardiaceae bacterium]